MYIFIKIIFILIFLYIYIYLFMICENKKQEIVGYESSLFRRNVDATEKSPNPRLFEAIVGMSKGVALMNCRSDWYGNPNGKTEFFFVLEIWLVSCLNFCELLLREYLSQHDGTTFFHPKHLW